MLSTLVVPAAAVVTGLFIWTLCRAAGNRCPVCVTLGAIRGSQGVGHTGPRWGTLRTRRSGPAGGGGGGRRGFV